MNLIGNLSLLLEMLPTVSLSKILLLNTKIASRIFLKQWEYEKHVRFWCNEKKRDLVFIEKRFPTNLDASTGGWLAKEETDEILRLGWPGEAGEWLDIIRWWNCCCCWWWWSMICWRRWVCSKRPWYFLASASLILWREIVWIWQANIGWKILGYFSYFPRLTQNGLQTSKFNEQLFKGFTPVSAQLKVSNC